MDAARTSYVIVGVVPRQPDAVVVEAAAIARRFGAELVCVQVNSKRYAVEELPNGTVISLSFDPELQEALEEEFDPEIYRRVAALLDGKDIAWSTRALAGDPARALGLLAEKLGALMIVVGTREQSLRGNIRSFINGSVAVHLAHRQRRPVVLIPLAPIGFENALPWDED